MGVLLHARRLLERLHLRKRRYWIERVDEIPDMPVPNVVYAIGDVSPWQAALVCPCGCKHLIQLSLIDHDSPRWSLQGQETGLATLYPSVWRTRGCKSHFILRKGQVFWCNSAKSARRTAIR
jgi:hypothetical protein